MSPPSFPPTAPRPGAPFPPPGLPGWDSPASRVLRGTPIPYRPSRRTSLPSLGSTVARLLFRSPAARGASQRSLGFGDRSPDRSLDGDGKASQVPGESPCVHAPLSDPGGRTSAKPLAASALWPSVHYKRRLPRCIFRGSITRPTRSLSTLRRTGHPSAAQDSLPTGGPALVGRAWLPAGSHRRFRHITQSCVSPSSRLSLAHLML